MAEAVKKEKKLFPTEDDRYRPLGFKIKYRVGDKIQKLKFIGHLWDRRLDIISQGAGDVVEVVSPQVEKEMVKLITYFRDYFF
jgi:hypothetical protein